MVESDQAGGLLGISGAKDKQVMLMVKIVCQLRPNRIVVHVGTNHLIPKKEMVNGVYRGPKNGHPGRLYGKTIVKLLTPIAESHPVRNFCIFCN